MEQPNNSRLPIYKEPHEPHSSCSVGGSPLTHPAPQGDLFAQSDFVGNAALVTLGCAKNQVDSEVMLGVLKSKGYRIVSEAESAELVVVNTCAFLESAVQEGIDVILDISKLKSEGRLRKLIVAGCMVERYRKDLEQSLPEVDRFISTDELLSVADARETAEEIWDEARRPYFIYDESMPRVRAANGGSAYLKVSEGCDRPCSFCIIPKIRGALRSRPVQSVVNEARQLVTEGVRELNLVAQDLTSYGVDLLRTRPDGAVGGSHRHTLLPELLRGLSELVPGGEAWVRLLYAYPIGVTEELVRTIVDNPAICNYLDLPLQHISNSVLKSMRRPLGERGTRGLIEMIRATAPEIALRTTFIVGFPGETEKDVESLRSFIAEEHFAHVGVFCFSQEKEADASGYESQVPKREREARRALLLKEQQNVVARRLQAFVGTSQQVLLEGAHSESDLLQVGRTAWQAPETDGEVIINEFADGLEDLRELEGRFATVEITDTAGYDLVGKLVNLLP